MITTESTSMKAWEDAGWDIRPFSVPSVLVAPPVGEQDIQEAEQPSNESAEDVSSGQRLTREQILLRIERVAKRRGLPYSAAELIQAYREQRLDDPSAVADLMALAGLLPDEDPLFVRP